MKKDIELEKFQFIGDSSVDRVICTKANGTKVTCTQTDFITALAQNRKSIKGGRKLRLNTNSGKVSYLIDYGNDENPPQQMIKVTMDEENLAKGDINALAVDSICQHSITVRKNNIKKKVINGVAATLVTISLTGALIGGFIYAAEKESKYESERMHEYITQMNDERRKNGLGPLTFGDDASSEVSYEDSMDDDLTNIKIK